MGAHIKKVLLNTIYYTLIASMVAFVVFFMISLANASMANWERVVFYILTILLVLAVVFDIICTCMRKEKHIVAWIIYGITIATIVFSLVVMALNSANGRLILDISERFFRMILFMYLINVFAILVYLVGEKLGVTISNRIKK